MVHVDVHVQGREWDAVCIGLMVMEEQCDDFDCFWFFFLASGVHREVACCSYLFYEIVTGDG